MHNKFLRVAVALLIISAILISAYSVLKILFPRKHFEIIQKNCLEYKVDANLVLALIKAESNFNEDAVSYAGAKGIMQLTDETFKFCNDTICVNGSDIFSPEENIRAGVWYLSYLLDRYEENEKNAVASYNAGATNVDSWLKDSRYSADGKTLYNIPFSETKRHIKKINAYKRIYKFLY